MNVGSIQCVNTAAENDDNIVIRCPISPTCSHEATLKKPENV